MSPSVDFLLSHMNRAITSILQSAGSPEKCAQLIFKRDVCYCRPWAVGQKPREVCEMFLFKSTNCGFYDSSRGLARPSSGQTTSLQCCPDAGSNLSCETISGPVEEDRGWGNASWLATVNAAAWFMQRLKDPPVHFERKENSRLTRP